MKNIPRGSAYFMAMVMHADRENTEHVNIGILRPVLEPTISPTRPADMLKTLTLKLTPSPPIFLKLGPVS